MAMNRATLLNWLTPSKHLNIQKNIAYGNCPRQTLDVYQPLAPKVAHPPSPAPLPVVVYVHGGSWTHGSKDDYLFLAEGLVSAGFVVVVINYRLAPKHVYPAYIEDTAAAIAWVHQHIAHYGGNPQSIIAMGHSAGAFNVVETCVNENWLTAAKVPVEAIKLVVGIAGPYSYDFTLEPSRNAFSANATPEQVMPDRHVRADAPPHVLVVAENDTLVKAGNCHRMLAALQHKSVPAKLSLISRTNHIFIVVSFSRYFRWMNESYSTILTEINHAVNPSSTQV